MAHGLFSPTSSSTSVKQICTPHLYADSAAAPVECESVCGIVCENQSTTAPQPPFTKPPPLNLDSVSSCSSVASVFLGSPRGTDKAQCARGCGEKVASK